MSLIRQMKVSEDFRRRATRVMAWGGWLAAFGLIALRVTGIVGQAVGVIVVLVIGVAIAAGSALSRMHLRDTIVGAFETGMNVAKDRMIAAEKSAGEDREDHEDHMRSATDEVLAQVRHNRNAIDAIQHKLDADAYRKVVNGNGGKQNK